MKKVITAVTIVLLIGVTGRAQSSFEVLPDTKNGGRILNGIISRELLQNDTAYNKWWIENLSGYTPSANALAALKRNADSIQLLVFMGTWCDDSHFVIPKFYSLLDAAGFPKEKVTLIGVNRSKKTFSHLTEALGIINVPTIIVYKNGKEAGRVVEYGKYGMFDKELGEIVTSSEKM